MKVQQNSWLEMDAREKLHKLAWEQHLSAGKLAALLISWGMKQMEMVGSIVELEKLSVAPPKRKMPQEDGKGVDSSARPQAESAAGAFRDVSQREREAPGGDQTDRDSDKQEARDHHASRPRRRKSS